MISEERKLILSLGLFYYHFLGPLLAMGDVPSKTGSWYI